MGGGAGGTRWGEVVARRGRRVSVGGSGSGGAWVGGCGLICMVVVVVGGLRWEVGRGTWWLEDVDPIPMVVVLCLVRASWRPWTVVGETVD